MEILLILLTFVILIGIIYYNKLIRKKNEVDNATGSINAMVKNRYDLIPNLIDTVKTYMTYESDVLNKITAMRAMALDDCTSDADKQKIDTEIQGALKKLMVSVENYPDLKANNNFLQLQATWTDIEDKIAASRRFYNNSTTEYNVAISSFPQNIIANLMGYKRLQIFEVSATEATNINAKSLFGNEKSTS